MKYDLIETIEKTVYVLSPRHELMAVIEEALFRANIIARVIFMYGLLFVVPVVVFTLFILDIESR